MPVNYARMDVAAIPSYSENGLLPNLINFVVPLATKVVETITVFGAVLAFAPQYWTIMKTKNTEGFSLYVCLALITAGILRITFWFGHPYEIPLLLQSVFLVLMMFAIVQLCTSLRHAHEPKRPARVFTDFQWKHFWEWTDFSSYFECVILFACLCGFLMYQFYWSVFFVEMVGLLAVLIEAVLAVPQFLRNHRLKSTSGVSLATVALMTFGDATKIIYFIVRDAPAQFWICGSLQLCVDFAIWSQVWLYRKIRKESGTKEEVLPK